MMKVNLGTNNNNNNDNDDDDDDYNSHRYKIHKIEMAVLYGSEINSRNTSNALNLQCMSLIYPL
jgi:hypothetical protein